MDYVCINQEASLHMPEAVSEPAALINTNQALSFHSIRAPDQSPAP